MEITLAGSVLAPWGQAAAIILGLYLFISILLGLGLAAGLFFGFAWLREKSELIKNLRPTVNQLNRSLTAAQHGEPLPAEVADNKIVQVVTQIPRVISTLPGRVSTIDQKVEQGSDRVAGVVIEFRARTEMVKGMARAFFLPGLTRPRVPVATETKIATVEKVQEPVAEKSSRQGEAEQRTEEEMVIVQSSR